MLSEAYRGGYGMYGSGNTNNGGGCLVALVFFALAGLMYYVGMGTSCAVGDVSCPSTTLLHLCGLLGVAILVIYGIASMFDN